MSFRAVRRGLSDGNEFVLQTFFGLLVGATVAAVVFCFHWLIDLMGGLASTPIEWPWWQRLLLPIAGAAIAWVLLTRFQDRAQLGVRHVLETLHRSPVHWPVTNAVIQFFLTPILLASGQSGGREGPSVHIGGTLGAWMTERMRLPRNNLRVMVGAGVAAAISATFGTPLAGVAFAMEVVVMEYTVAGFLPIIAAAVAASWLIHLLLGDALVAFPDLSSLAMPALGWIVVLGMLAGVISACFNRVVQLAIQNRPPYAMIWAGVLCGLVGIWVPEIMGDGFVSINALLTQPLIWQTALVLLVAKLLVTAVSVGLGLPIGFIGPLLVTGATLGSLVGVVSGDFNPLLGLIGMSAVMAGSLMAPMAAVLFIIELSQQPDLTLAALTGVAIACIVHRALKQDGIFIQQLADEGRPLALHQSNHPMNHLGIGAALDGSVVQVTDRFTGIPAKVDNVVWQCGRRKMHGLPWLEFISATQSMESGNTMSEHIKANLLCRVPDNATLAEVWSKIRTTQTQGAYIRSPDGELAGIIWRHQLEDRFQ